MSHKVFGGWRTHGFQSAVFPGFPQQSLKQLWVRHVFFRFGTGGFQELVEAEELAAECAAVGGPFGFAAGRPTRRDTIVSWELSPKTRIFLAELLCFVERECQSKLSSTIWKAERHSKNFSRDFPPCRVKQLSLLSKKQNTCYSRVPKCAS